MKVGVVSPEGSNDRRINGIAELRCHHCVLHCGCLAVVVNLSYAQQEIRRVIREDTAGKTQKIWRVQTQAVSLVMECIDRFSTPFALSALSLLLSCY